MNDERKKFLVHIYNQMFNDINRHIMVVWQSVGVLVGAFAIFTLVEKEVVSLDIAVTIISLLCAWLFAHLFDAAYWYNRNLVIIANIERIFLEQKDLKRIHYYFGSHRKKNKMIEHLRIQFALGLGLVAIVYLYHFIERVYPGLDESIENFELLRALPYIFFVACVIYLIHLKKAYLKKYDEFISNSPGIDIDAGDINYGIGHGH